MSELAWLALGLMLFTVGMVGVGALTVLGIVMPHDPPGWTGAPVGLALALSAVCILQALIPPRG